MSVIRKVSGTVGSKKYYFNPSDGKAKTGWLELDGKKYYFDTSGVMLANTIASIDGTTYRFDSDGAATKTSGNDYTVEGKYVKVFDAKNNKYYYMEEEFLNIRELQTERCQIWIFWQQCVMQKQEIRESWEWRQLRFAY